MRRLAFRVNAIARYMWRFLLYFVRAKKVWRRPRNSEVLIYDAEGHEDLQDYLSPWDPEVLHVRGEQVNIPVLLASLVGFGRLNRYAYVDCFVRRVCPRLIITFIDNKVSFYSLAARHQNLKTLFVQNGTRAYYGGAFGSLERAPPSSTGFKVDYMMTFGSHVGREYTRFIEGCVVPMGSLKNNAVPRRKTTKEGSLVFISQYRVSEGMDINGRFYPREECYEQADRFVLQWLIWYAKEKGKDFSIISCSSCHANGLEDEQRYYRDLLGQDCDLLHESGKYASYDAADAAEVVVSIDSTLGYESAARGNKTAIFAVRLEPWGIRGLTFGWPGPYPDGGPFWTNRQDTSAFERILDYLFSITEEEWQAQLRTVGFADIMAFDPGNTVLRSVLRRELSPPVSTEYRTTPAPSSALASR